MRSHHIALALQRPGRHAALAVFAMVTAMPVLGARDAAPTVSVGIGGSVTLVVSAAGAPGSGLASASDSTIYTVANDAGVKALVGRLDADLPAHLTMTVELSPPVGAASAGVVTLTSSDQPLVTNIGVVDEAGLTMAFTLSATVEAGPTGPAARSFFLTLVDTP
jgi:hypothetical protein